MEGGWRALQAGLNREWRKRLDPTAYEEERAWIATQMGSTKVDNKKRLKEEISTLTLEGLLNETFFINWGSTLSTEIVTASRKIVKDSIVSLARNIKSNNKNLVEDSLQDCIQSFNRLNNQHQFIDAFKREEICHELKRIANAVGFKDEHLFDKWRDW